jgi:hypothetical protein
MSLPEDTPQVRTEQEIIAELLEVCTQPGFIHVIGMICFRDNIVGYVGKLKPEDYAKLFSPTRLIRTEVSTLDARGAAAKRPPPFQEAAAAARGSAPTERSMSLRKWMQIQKVLPTVAATSKGRLTFAKVLPRRPSACIKNNLRPAGRANEIPRKGFFGGGRSGAWPTATTADEIRWCIFRALDDMRYPRKDPLRRSSMGQIELRTVGGLREIVADARLAQRCC